MHCIAFSLVNIITCCKFYSVVTLGYCTFEHLLPWFIYYLSAILWYMSSGRVFDLHGNLPMLWSVFAWPVLRGKNINVAIFSSSSSSSIPWLRGSMGHHRWFCNQFWNFLEHYKCDECQTLHWALQTLHWALPIHKSSSDLEYITGSQQCQTVLTKIFNVLIWLSWNFVGLLSLSSISWVYHFFFCEKKKNAGILGR